MRTRSLIKISEDSICKTIVEWASLNAPFDKLLIHVPNEGKRSLGEGRKLKSMGMRKGVSDFFISVPRHGYHGAWIEIKTLSGTASAHQRDFLTTVAAQGYFAKIVYGLDEALDTIRWYCEK